MKWSFSYYSFVKCLGQKKLGSHKKIVLYPNLCYNKVLHKGTALRTVVSISCVLAHLYIIKPIRFMMTISDST